MANIRSLKKDIDYLFFELISDCFTYASLHNGDKTQDVKDLIEEAVASRNEFIEKANNPSGKDDPKLVKKYFVAIRKELFEKVDSYFNKLSEITKSK